VGAGARCNGSQGLRVPQIQRRKTVGIHQGLYAVHQRRILQVGVSRIVEFHSANSELADEEGQLMPVTHFAEEQMLLKFATEKSGIRMI